MPVLTRVVSVPLCVDIRTGAVASLAPLLADHRISSGGQVAVAVGPGQGEDIATTLDKALPQAVIIRVEPGTIDGAQELATKLRGGSYDALVGIGGGRLLDTAKWASTMTGLPMVSVPTSLAHDGIASPVASLTHDGRKASFGVQPPLAVVVDLEHVRRAPARLRRSGVGDVLSNLTAVLDWELAADVRGEQVDGVAAAMARSAAHSVIDRTDGIDDLPFLTSLADALVLSGVAMTVAGSSRPCSGSDHELVHAVDALFPGAANHGELAGLGALFSAVLREEGNLAGNLHECLRRHGLPATPAEIGLDEEEFLSAVLQAPSTRPDRYTILEHLSLSAADLRHRIHAYACEWGISL
jgi:glycerol-1-phosphate dehydrogenase [NAD(P)+]